jgi:hypothetical protein
MSRHETDLAVRRHIRYACDFPASVTVAPVHARAVRLGRSVAGTDGVVAARIVDCSLGGVGLHAGLFLPLTCALCTTFEINGQKIEALVRIQRVTMCDRKPTYYLGAAFENPGDRLEETMAALLEALRASGAKPVPENSGA